MFFLMRLFDMGNIFSLHQQNYKYTRLQMFDAENPAPVDPLTAQNEALAAQNEAPTAQVAALTAQNEALAAQNEALTAQVEALTAQVEALTAQVAVLAAPVPRESLSETQCPVCMENLDEGDICRPLCLHMYHQTCVRHMCWVTGAKCAVCRAPIEKVFIVPLSSGSAACAVPSVA